MKLWSAFLVVSLLLLTACSLSPRTTATPKPLAVGVVLPTRDEPRWLQDEVRFREAFQKAGYEADILFSDGSVEQELANVRDLVNRGIRVLIICPHDVTAAAPAAELAANAGVKVISYDRLIFNTRAVDYYVTFDSLAVGEQQARYLIEHASGTGNPLFLYSGALSDSNSYLFFAGAWTTLQPAIANGTFVIKNSPAAVALQHKAGLTREEMTSIMAEITTDWKPETARALAQSNLQALGPADKGVVYILAPNDGMARAIGEVFAADPAVTRYFLTGQDAEQFAVQAILDGKQSMTVFKDVRVLVQNAILTALTLLEGEQPVTRGIYNNGVKDVPAIQAPVITVDREHVRVALIDSGYYKVSDFKNLP